MAHVAHRPKRAPFRETPTAEALAIDRWSFGAALGVGPRDVQIVKPGAFGLMFEVPPACMFEPDCVSPEGIAVLPVRGPLEHHPSWCWASYDDIAAEVQAALECEQVKALVLRIDSPGGVAAGMGQAHRAIRRMQRETGKLVFAYVDEMACSAAYNVASACAEIWMPREAVVGSIGVILCTVDESEALEKAGVRVRYVVTGDRKADLHPGAPVTDEVLDVAQGKVDELGRHFFRAVGKARGTTPQAVRGLQAAVFQGQSAVDVGLADGVSDWPAFLDTLRAALSATVPGTRGTRDARPNL